MDEEKIVIKAKRRRVLSKLAPALQDLGFSKVSSSKDRLVLEKIQGEDLYGKKHLNYRIVFSNASIELAYTLQPGTTKRKRLLELLPVLFSVLQIAEDYYEFKFVSMLEPMKLFVNEAGAALGSDAADLSFERDSYKERFADLSKKYQELVRSSEENARILLECERKVEELKKRGAALEAMSDETLKDELFRWLKMHNGAIVLSEFSSAHKVPAKRIEEGLNLLIREGYIKKRSL